MILTDRLNALRQQALDNGLPTKRKNRDLYGLLSSCLELCEEVIRDGLEPELRKALTVSTVGQTDNANHGKRYVYKSADAFRLVCRFTLQDCETKQLVSRYTSALREAHQRQIKSSELRAWMEQNGGVLALYRSRPTLGSRSGGVRELDLRQSIDFPRDGTPFTLCLRYDGKGFFEVISNKEGEP